MTIERLLMRAAEKDPQKIYLYYADDKVCYATFAENVSRAAGAFWELGLRRGDKVCLMLPNCSEFLYAWLGLAKIGVISVFVSAALRGEEIKYIANHSQAKAIVTRSEFLETFDSIKAELPHVRYPVVCADRSCCAGTLSLAALLQGASARSGWPPVRPEDIAAFIYTSGTTGPPKAVMQTHRTYFLTGEAFPYWLGLNSEDRLFSCLPLSHINAQAYSAMGSLAAGASLILADKFSAVRFWEQIERYGATEFNLIGAMPLFLLKQPVKPAESRHSARAAYTAPALPRRMHEKFEERFGVTLTVGYGMSESTFGTINPVDKNKRAVGSIGLPRSHADPQFPNDLRIVDDERREVPTGEVGEITLKNPTVMQGYYRDPEATQAALSNGWLFTGDLAYRDSRGFLYFAGRKKDMIRLKGENISAFEVESVIEQHPAVLESAVIAIPSELGEEAVKAFVVVKSGQELSAHDILEWCSQRLAGFKVPGIVEFRNSLPKTSTLKTAKHLLREEALRGEGQPRRGNLPLSLKEQP